MLLENYLQRLFPGPSACKAYMLYAVLCYKLMYFLHIIFFYFLINLLTYQVGYFSFSFINIYYETYIKKKKKILCLPVQRDADLRVHVLIWKVIACLVLNSVLEEVGHRCMAVIVILNFIKIL